MHPEVLSAENSVDNSKRSLRNDGKLPHTGAPQPITSKHRRLPPPVRPRRGSLKKETALLKEVKTYPAAPGDDAVASELKIEEIGRSVVSISQHCSNSSGHFCDVFFGIHTVYGKVALKRPRLGLSQNTETIRRFVREAQIWQGLKHEYVLPFIGAYRMDDHLYLVSPFMENGTLWDYVRLNGDVDRVRLLLEVAEALAYLHSRGVIHGDIKGANILISGSHHAQLCDFGLSKFSSSNTSAGLKGAGTVRWQSPEILSGTSPRTTASDVWAFAMLITEVLTGSVPFAQYEHSTHVMIAILVRAERPATEPKFGRNRVPYHPVWRIASQCWETNAEKRPNMSEVARQLRLNHKAPALSDTPAQSIVDSDDEALTAKGHQMSLEDRHKKNSLRSYSGELDW